MLSLEKFWAGAIVLSMNTKTHGFTLVELMVTLAVAGVLMAIGVPAYQDFVLNSKRTAAVNDMLADFQIARSSSISRNSRIVLCSSTNGTGCANSDNWDTGWIMFQDDDADGVKDGGEEVLASHEATPQNTITGSFRAVAYRPNGRVITYTPVGTAANTLGTVTVCDSRGATMARAVIIKTSGRPESSTTQVDGSALSC